MKKISDIKFTVVITSSYIADRLSFYWFADGYSRNISIIAESDNFIKSEKKAKESWEEFAKVNGIKKWKYNLTR